MPQKTTNRQKVFNALKKAKQGLSVIEITKATGLTKKQARNTISNYDPTTVSLGDGKYALAKYALLGVRFRHTPIKEELENRTLQAEDEISYFLLQRNFDDPITLIDKTGKKYTLRHIYPTKKIPFAHFRGFAPFFKKTKFALGDDLIFQIKNVNKRLFLVTHVPKKNRNEEAIKKADQKLANLVYGFLKYSFQKHEMLMFLSPRILPRLRNFKVPPDPLGKALACDKRLICFRKQFDLYFGRVAVPKRWLPLIIGLRKYAVKNPKGEIVFAAIDEDEFGCRGFCSHCGIPLTWSKKSGWYHPDVDPMEYHVYRGEVELDPEFFKID